jgi:hypothetical protein
MTPANNPTAPTVGTGAMTNGKGQPLLNVQNLKMHFPITRGFIFQRQVGAI